MKILTLAAAILFFICSPLIQENIMKDFAKPYTGAVHFGHYLNDSADKFGQRDALKVLKNALDECRETDMRQQDVYDALGYLESLCRKSWPFQQFRNALNSTDPEGRWQNVNAALNGIEKAVRDG